MIQNSGGKSKYRMVIALCALCAAGAFCLSAYLQLSHALPPITREEVRSAERLIDLEFTSAERDSVLDRLGELRAKYQNLRKISIANSIPPAIVFNPIPIGFKFPQSSSRFELSPAEQVQVPLRLEDLAYYSVRQLAELVRTRKVTSTELTRLALERLKKFDPVLLCTVTLTEERALQQARQADREIASGTYRGPLHGIPYGAKDLLATKGIRTTWGSAVYRDQVPEQDATVIRRLEEAGAVLVAKFSMGELAMGDVWFGGMTRNPWDVTEGSSGSSAGSAAATAAGLVPFAIGTETWGSIVSPSTRCGTTGLRPSYGRVSRTGAMALSWSMDKIGTICRTAEDCALVLNAIYGPDGVDQTVYDLPFNYSPRVDLNKLRIGYLKSAFDSASANDRAVLEKLRSLGARPIPIELPRLPVMDCSIILSAEAAAAFDDLTRSGKDDLLVQQTKDAWPNEFRGSRMIPAVEYLQANRVRYTMIQEMEKLMKQVDCYVAPSSDDTNLLLTNLTGHPCVVVPNGFSEKGTPTTISFIGRLFDEGTLLAVAKRYQDATDFHLKHPPLFP
jgi:Asp-tRNA(Asn)/Glu-tRNA(Gln) amidotransferase A subunit family amidase